MEAAKNIGTGSRDFPYTSEALEEEKNYLFVDIKYL